MNNDQLKPIDIKDNSFTIVLKVNGKLYVKAAEFGPISAEMADEDLDSALRAMRGASVSSLRTLALKGANRPDDYKLPMEASEQDLSPISGTAGEDIVKGNAVIFDPASKEVINLPADEAEATA